MSHSHYKIYKPYGYLSQFINNQTKRKNKKLLGELGDFAVGTMAIGRLDEKSEGLLLLTTDGKISDQILSRKYEKEYYVLVDGAIEEHHLEELRSGVLIGIHGKKYKTLKCEVDFLEEEPNFEERSKKIRDSRHGPTTWIRIILREGKFRQIRKMTSAVGFPTLRLVRVRIGENYLINYTPGHIIKLDEFKL